MAQRKARQSNPYGRANCFRTGGHPTGTWKSSTDICAASQTVNSSPVTPMYYGAFKAYPGILTLFTLFEGVRPLRRASAIRDVFAGVALAAMNIPQALGYTKIAGMPVVTGLYTLLFPLMAFGIFGSSRYLVVSADSATAAILSGGLAGMAPVASPRYVALAGLVALLTAGFLLLSRVLKLGFLADFLSQTVLIGFLTGVGFQVGIAVFGQMLGIQVSSRRSIVQLVEVCGNLPRAHLPTLLVSACVLFSIPVLRRFAPKVPGALLVVIGGIAASWAFHFAARGIATIGPVIGGLPRFGLYGVGWKDALPLCGVAGSCAVMILTQSAATSRVYASRNQQRLDENQDLLGLSAANAAAALSGAFVVNGSPTQTAMVVEAGAQSQIAQFATAGVVTLVLIFLTGPLQYLPRCVLGALVFLVAVHLIDLRSLRSMRNESPGEFALALTTTAIVVGAGVEQGILGAMVISLLRIVAHSYHPHSGVLIHDANGSWKTIPVVAGAKTEPGLVLYRFGAALFYANAGRFAEEVRCLVGPAPSSVRWLVVDAEAITGIDYSAARVVIELQESLSKGGVDLCFARLRWDTRSDFDRHHLTEVVGTSHIFDKIHDALNAFAKLPISS